MGYQPVKSLNHKYIFEVEFPLNYVWDRIQKGKNLRHNKISYPTTRLQVYRDTGLVCKHCGLEATRCIGGRTVKNNQHHVDFYGINADGVYVAFTLDHIIPKSKGGTDDLENLQTLCLPCNAKKADK